MTLIRSASCLTSSWARRDLSQVNCSKVTSWNDRSRQLLSRLELPSKQSTSSNLNAQATNNEETTKSQRFPTCWLADAGCLEWQKLYVSHASRVEKLSRVRGALHGICPGACPGGSPWEPSGIRGCFHGKLSAHAVSVMRETGTIMDTSCTLLCLHRERLCHETQHNKTVATSFAAHPLSTIIMQDALLHKACLTALSCRD